MQLEWLTIYIVNLCDIPYLTEEMRLYSDNSDNI